MKIKLFDDSIKEMDFGTLYDTGEPSYILHPEIKELLIDGEWIKNPGFNLEEFKLQKLLRIESQIVDISIKLDKANSLNLQTQISELTEKLSGLNKQRDEVNAL